MTSVIIEASALSNVVGMGIVDEVFNLLAVFLLILSILFVVDFGLDIEEGGSAILSALATMSLLITY